MLSDRFILDLEAGGSESAVVPCCHRLYQRVPGRAVGFFFAIPGLLMVLIEYYVDPHADRYKLVQLAVGVQYPLAVFIIWWIMRLSRTNRSRLMCRRTCKRQGLVYGCLDTFWYTFQILILAIAICFFVLSLLSFAQISQGGYGDASAHDVDVIYLWSNTSFPSNISFPHS